VSDQRDPYTRAFAYLFAQDVTRLLDGPEAGKAKRRKRPSKPIKTGASSEAWVM
jgi:hypothetical protein